MYKIVRRKTLNDNSESHNSGNSGADCLTKILFVGNTECLTEALELLRGEILKKRNLMFRPKYPREWLGRLDIEGIRRLVPSKAVDYDTHRKIKGYLKKFGDNIS